MSHTPTDRVAAVIDDLFGVPPDALTPDLSLHDGLQLDSLSLVELRVAVEDALEVDLGRAGEDSDIVTFGDLVAAVEAARRAERRAS